jgi:adenine phosphoribosyltransferase
VPSRAAEPVRSFGPWQAGDKRRFRMDLKAHIRTIPDFPKPGILFYDISTLLGHAEAWRETVDRLADAVRAYRPDMLAAIESRGFIFAAPVAYKLGIAFTMVRKVGKLPGAVISHAYDLEYGSDTLQVADGLIARGSRVVIMDDLLATGGTADASVQLIKKIGAEVAGAVFLIELMGLKGRARINVPMTTLIGYEGG